MLQLTLARVRVILAVSDLDSSWEGGGKVGQQETAQMYITYWKAWQHPSESTAIRTPDIIES